MRECRCHRLLGRLNNWFQYWRRYWFIALMSVFSIVSGLYLFFCITPKDISNGLVCITISISLWGWLVSKKHTDENIIKNKRIEYLCEAYELIALATARSPTEDPNYSEFTIGLEKAVAIIQLHGDIQEHDQIYQLVEEFNKIKDGTSQEIKFDDLLTTLRNNLRKQLLLPEIHKPIIPFRAKKNSSLK